ncbi:MULTISPECIES: YhbD family protein [unclassified Paenibacillus]|uniref:YhbD family protein n=1 Tax=unclassified Paenibacillus TaxID=185978 RepID=UPI0036304B4D
METQLISKKELLELTGLSYGQLYRWKRKNLIPEDWFIRKSAFTGQETFFPKDKILGRIDKIKNMKDDLSLDELANLLSPNAAEISLTKQELIERNIVSSNSLEFYCERQGHSDSFDFERILQLFIFDKMLHTGEISLDEGFLLLQVMNEHYPKLQGNNGELIFIRKMGFSTFLLAEVPANVYFEPNIRVVARLLLSNCMEELKFKMN